MTTPRPRAAGKSRSGATGPRPANPAPTPDSSSAPKNAARQGVPSAVRPDPHPAPDTRRITGWLHITAPRGATPTATAWCACGRDRHVTGHQRVADLIQDHTDHRTQCPRRRITDERAAA